MSTADEKRRELFKRVNEYHADQAAAKTIADGLAVTVFNSVPVSSWQKGDIMVPGDKEHSISGYLYSIPCRGFITRIADVRAILDRDHHLASSYKEGEDSLLLILTEEQLKKAEPAQ